MGWRKSQRSGKEKKDLDYGFSRHKFRIDGNSDHFIRSFAASYHSDSSKHVIRKEDTDMSDKVFIRILVSIVAAGVIVTALHAAYIYYAYEHSSIIYFISKELWP